MLDLLGCLREDKRPPRHAQTQDLAVYQPLIPLYSVGGRAAPEAFVLVRYVLEDQLLAPPPGVGMALRPLHYTRVVHVLILSIQWKNEDYF